MSREFKKTEVLTGKVRFSFINVFKPRAAIQGAEEKYSATILLPKSDIGTKADIDAAIQAAIEQGKEKWGGVVPPKVPNPVWDGDGLKSDGTPFGPECKGHWVFTASAKSDYKPGVVNAQLQPIIDQTEIYSGIYGRASINFFPYMFAGKKGVGCGLGNVQKLTDGEPLSGRRSAEEVFGRPIQNINPITGQPM